MKIINIGVLAHVDAGKTTLTESLLYNSGAITELGSVDKGTTRTDNTLLERQRGITIQTGITSFQWENTKVNIIDTPGHMDFLAEVYRSLSVLDGAILLISAKDGVQAQTRILFHALRKMGIPTIFFINKIDQNGIDLSTVYQDIKEKLSAEIVIKQKVELYPNMCVTNFTESEQWDTVIEGNDDLLEKYTSGKLLEALELEQEESIRFHNCSLFPVYHGSAKNNIGIDNLRKDNGYAGSSCYVRSTYWTNGLRYFIRCIYTRNMGCYVCSFYCFNHDFNIFKKNFSKVRDIIQGVK